MNVGIAVNIIILLIRVDAESENFIPILCIALDLYLVVLFLN
jgi:hypothetical protein